MFCNHRAGGRICFEMIIKPLHFPLPRGYLAGEDIARGKKMLSVDLQIFANYEPARWLQNLIPLIPVAQSAASAGGFLFREHFSARETKNQSTKVRRLPQGESAGDREEAEEAAGVDEEEVFGGAEAAAGGQFAVHAEGCLAGVDRVEDDSLQLRHPLDVR